MNKKTIQVFKPAIASSHKNYKSSSVYLSALLTRNSSKFLSNQANWFISRMSLSSKISELISIVENDIPVNSSNNRSSKPTFANKKEVSKIEKELSDENENENKNEDEDASLLLKTAKGTRDYNSGEMAIREKMMKIIKKNFDRFGGQSMETPVFELRDILMDKYGEDEKLIYEMADQGGGEPLCLRYDLTVPLARFTAMNRKNLKSPFKAARVGRVYRRDQPRMTKGRLREFWQCDFDIVRTGWDDEKNNSRDLILDDCEIVAMVCQILSDLNIGDFRLCINNRKLLDAILNECKVPNELIRPISAAIDKLDKKEWCEVKTEMIEKGISGESAEMIKEFVEINGTPSEVLPKLRSNKILQSNEALEEFELLLKFLEEYNKDFLKYIRIDMSMVRGLDYYTGIIMEGQFEDRELATDIGSIAGGGRYDGLVGRFVKNQSFPCVGASIGFERIFSFLKEKYGIDRGVSTKVLVCELSFKGGPALGYYNERLKLLNDLRNNGNINSEIMNKISPDFRSQINYCEDREIEWMVIIGEDELKTNTVNLRRLTLPNDIVVLKDGNKLAKIIRIEQLENQKFPQFIVKFVDDNGNIKPNTKEQTINKKSIIKVVCNGKPIDLQIKALKRDELITFLQSVL